MKSPIARRTVLVNGVLGVVLIAGAGYGYASLQDDGGSQTQTGGIGTVRRGTLLSSVSASGSVASANTAGASFGTSGTVTSIEVQTGDKVRKGDVLARLDDTAARENVTVAKASYDAASSAYSSATSANSAQAYSSYVSARNSYNDAQRTLAATVLTAPISGTVTAVNGNVGGSSSGSSSSSSSGSSSSSSSGGGGGGGGGGAGGGGGGGSSSSSSSSSSSGSTSGFVTISDAGHLEITADFTEADTTKLKIGQAATISFDALPNVTASGKVASIASQSTTSNNVVSYAVTITLDTAPKSVRLGATASAQVTVAQAENVLYVPAAAVRTLGGQSLVTVVKNGKQTQQIVQVGIKGDAGTEITSGLSEGEQVVLQSTTTGSTFNFGNRLGGGGLGGVGGGAVRRGGG